ncbi:hypothetical protein Dcae01_02611 [Deinococcus caeni]|uniref:Uncharacterized protein n=2 Tax=Deinococcus caeni TaxID=569127 RepID=A0ABP9UEU4_9DEIO
MVDRNLPKDFYTTRVQDVAQERYYYDFLGDNGNQYLERLFSLIEGDLSQKYRNLLNSVHDGYILSHDEKQVIISFLKLQLIRSDWMRNKIPDAIVDNLFKEDYVPEGKRLLHAYIIHEGTFAEQLDYLINYQFKVFKADQNLGLFTSSFPCYFHHVGDLDDLLELILSNRRNSRDDLFMNMDAFFPLSSDFCIYIQKLARFSEIDDQNWYSHFVTSGISWASDKIFFKETKFSTQLYPALKPIIKSSR